MTDTLTCQELVELVTHYVEGALSPQDRMRFEDHLKGCTGCRNYVGQIRLTIELLGDKAVVTIPPEAEAELLQAFKDWKNGK